MCPFFHKLILIGTGALRGTGIGIGETHLEDLWWDGILKQILIPLLLD